MMNRNKGTGIFWGVTLALILGVGLGWADPAKEKGKGAPAPAGKIEALGTLENRGGAVVILPAADIKANQAVRVKSLGGTLEVLTVSAQTPDSQWTVIYSGKDMYLAYEKVFQAAAEQNKAVAFALAVNGDRQALQPVAGKAGLALETVKVDNNKAVETKGRGRGAAAAAKPAVPAEDPNAKPLGEIESRGAGTFDLPADRLKAETAVRVTVESGTLNRLVISQENAPGQWTAIWTGTDLFLPYETVFAPALGEGKGQVFRFAVNTADAPGRYDLAPCRIKLEREDLKRNKAVEQKGRGRGR